MASYPSGIGKGNDSVESKTFSSVIRLTANDGAMNTRDGEKSSSPSSFGMTMFANNLSPFLHQIYNITHYCLTPHT